MGNKEHESVKVPRHQLRSNLECGDNVNANGFWFEVLEIEKDKVELNPLENLMTNEKLNEEITN